jgi:2-amino-4-hydroxy-6-hydroxymethyldihydropteridine diphosphokinase
MPAVAYIALGSNLGDRQRTLDGAVASLRTTPGIVVRSVSRFHETEPVGGPDGQGKFLNGAAALETTLNPRELLHALQGIETSFGRVRKVRWGERTLDLDILLFDGRIIREQGLTVPHPRMAERRFVLEPLAEIAPHVVDPVSGRTVAEMLAELK